MKKKIKVGNDEVTIFEQNAKIGKSQETSFNASVGTYEVATMTFKKSIDKLWLDLLSDEVVKDKK